MKKYFTPAILIVLVLTLWTAAWAQPDPRDSIILESKTVDSNLTGAPAFTMKIYITNKDTLGFLTLAFVESTTVGAGYAILDSSGSLDDPDGWVWRDMVNPVRGTLDGTIIEDFSQYNGTSPDRFLLAGGFNPAPGLPLRNAEFINLSRVVIWELQFGSTTNSSGLVRLDTTRLTQSTLFTIITNQGQNAVDIPVNFVAAQCTVGMVSTDVREVNQGQRPQTYSLSQNYPNPFNANTQISFALPKAGKTRLEVFNILGQKVNTLVDEYMLPKSYIVNWDGRDDRGREVPSGIYFYRLRSEGFLQTKKMLMIQ